jgi:hypothetical protein
MNDKLAQRALDDLRDVVRGLGVAVAALPADSRSRSAVGSLAWQIEKLIPDVEKELRGERYVCRCCGAESFRPFGGDPTICGPCHNGIHHDHAPTEAVAAENRKRGVTPRYVKTNQ